MQSLPGSAGVWLGRYRAPLPIRSRGAFQVFSASREDDGRGCVVIVPGANTDVRLAAAAFAEIERVHGLLEHPQIPAVTARGLFQRTPYIELTCDAVMDGVAVHAALVRSARKVPVAPADGLVAALRLAMRSAHGVTDPRTRRPVCLARLSLANLLFSRTGRWYLVGYGHNFPVETEHGRPVDGITSFQAPELSGGEAPSPEGDYVALLFFMRSLLPVVDLAPVIVRLISGELGPVEAELLSALRWPGLHMIDAPAHLRRGIQEAEAVADRVRTICGVEPDPAGFVRYVCDLLEPEPAPAGAPHPGSSSAVIFGVETSWVAGADGVRHPLSLAQRRIVTALADMHRSEPGAVLTIPDLIEVGWPGERPSADAGANRVHVVLTQLRRLGMRDVLERSGGGYRFVPTMTVKLAV
jgi:hypothetical protein